MEGTFVNPFLSAVGLFSSGRSSWGDEVLFLYSFYTEPQKFFELNKSLLPKNISSLPYSMINLYTFVQDWRPLSYNYLISQICISDTSLHRLYL